MQIGVIIALISAVTSTLRESVRKLVSSDLRSIEIGYLGQLYGTIFLSPIAAFIYYLNGFNWSIGVITALLISTGVVISTTYLYIEAMRIADFSVTESLRQTTPIFVAFLEPLILGITFQPVMIFGALLGALGSYILVADDGLLEPVENMKNKGGMLSILVAIIFAIWAIVSRFGATNSDPYLFSYFTFVLGLLGFWIWKKKRSISIQKEYYLDKNIILLAVLTSLGAVVTIYAYSYISASEVTIIKQISGILGIFVGGRYFREKELIRKALGAITILAAVLLILI
ncbi:MAG: drug/metabolite transporter (DMT)-like permease [Candidatus Nanohaloarchaea archaeon]|jgi:drug/metabolite transporter (DMT)-like permease